MPNTKTSQETPADALAGDELVRIVQSSISKRTTARDIANVVGCRTIDVTIYTLLQSDHKYRLVFTDDTGVDVTVPYGLNPGFSCDVFQFGNGVVNFSPAVGVTLHSSQGFAQTAGQYSKMTIENVMQDVYVLTGEGSVLQT